VRRKKERGKKERRQVDPSCQREKERKEARSGWGQGKAGPGVAHVGRRRKRGEGDGPRGKKGRPKGEEGRQVGLPS
jgi:hypothetical protein